MAEVDQITGHSIVDPLPVILNEQPSLSWCDVSAPIEFDSETFPELKRQFHHRSNEPSGNTNSNSSAVLGKNSSDDDLLQRINVSNILGDDPTCDDITVDMTIPSDKVGLVIGRGGKTIKILQEKSGSKMNIIQASSCYEDYDKTLRLGPGPPDLVEHARQLVADLLSKTSNYQFKHKNEYERSTGRTGGRYNNNNNNNGGRFKSIRLPVPKAAVGLIIGKRGETIKRIRMETGAKVQFDPISVSLAEMDEQVAVIMGKPDQIRHACDLIEELVDTAMNGMKKDRDRDRDGGRGGHNNPTTNTSTTFYNEDNYDQQSNHQQQQQLDRLEEERVTVPSAKVKLVIGKGRESIRNIIQQSGAQCEIDRNVPPDSIEKTFVVKGSRQQVELAKEMILDKINLRSFKRHPRDRVGGHQSNRTSDNCGPGGGDYRSNEWGQGDPGPSASWTTDSYYDPVQNEQQEHDRRFTGSRSSQDYGYSQWLEYFQPERQQAQADAWEQQVKAEQDISDPQQSILDNDSSQKNQEENVSNQEVDPQSEQSQGPPGFSPISPVSVPTQSPGQTVMGDFTQNWSEQNEDGVEDQETIKLSDTQKNSESEDLEKLRKAQGDHPINLKHEARHEHEPGPGPGQVPMTSQQQHRPPGLTIQGPCPGPQNFHREVPISSNPHVHPIHIDGPPGNPTFIPYFYGQPVPQAFVHAPVIAPSCPRVPGGPTGGSCTRIVTLFYDINCNSIVVLNQWHFS